MSHLFDKVVNYLREQTKTNVNPFDPINLTTYTKDQEEFLDLMYADINWRLQQEAEIVRYDGWEDYKDRSEWDYDDE
jgi:hypothetical protein